MIDSDGGSANWVIYRGVMMRRHPNATVSMYGLTIGFANRKSLVKLLTYDLSLRDLDLHVVDAYWPALMHRASAFKAVSWDGVPWEIHGIEDDVVREEAVSSFLTNKTK